MSRLHWQRPLTLCTLLATVTACGIQPTPVLNAGEPPTGVATGPFLYFISADGPRLTMVRRTTGRLGDIRGAVELLLAGPDAAERAQGLASQVPRSTSSVEVEPVDNGTRVTVPIEQPLTRLARGQIVCTAATVLAATHRGDLATLIEVRTRAGTTYPRAHCSQLRFG